MQSRKTLILYLWHIVFEKSFLCTSLFKNLTTKHLKTISGCDTVWTEKFVENIHLTIRSDAEYNTSEKTHITAYSVLTTKSLKSFLREANLLSYSRITLNLKIT